MSTTTLPSPTVERFPSRRFHKRREAKVSTTSIRPLGIETRATEALENHPHFHGRCGTVDITCDGERLTLTGCLPSYYLKQLAQEAVRRFAGSVDLEIVNEIAVNCDSEKVRDVLSKTNFPNLNAGLPKSSIRKLR